MGVSWNRRPKPFLPGSEVPTGATFLWSSGNTLTINIKPWIPIREIWIPIAGGDINVYIGQDTSGPIYYTVKAPAAEAVPIDPSATYITLQYPNGFPAPYYIFARSWSSGGYRQGTLASAVTSVAATAPIHSSGGQNPNISIDDPLGTAHGGTGTINPQLIAGSGIVITGTPFDWTIAALASGTVQSVGANSPLHSSGGNTPVLSIDDPLPVINGGNGTATPTLLAGLGIGISGSWPAQTISSQALFVVRTPLLAGPGPYLLTLPTLPGGVGATWDLFATAAAQLTNGSIELDGTGGNTSWNAGSTFTNAADMLIQNELWGTAAGGANPTCTCTLGFSSGKNFGIFSLYAIRTA